MKTPVADAYCIADFYNGIFRVELAVSLFVRLLNALYALDDFLRVDILYIDGMGVADKSENGRLNAVPAVYLYVIIGSKLVGELVYPFGCG